MENAPLHHQRCLENTPRAAQSSVGALCPQTQAAGTATSAPLISIRPLDLKCWFLRTKDSRCGDSCDEGRVTEEALRSPCHLCGQTQGRGCHSDALQPRNCDPIPRKPPGSGIVPTFLSILRSFVDGATSCHLGRQLKPKWGAFVAILYVPETESPRLPFSW